MSTQFQIDFMLSGLVNSVGSPLSGGKVYTYAAGTSTPQATYLDANGTTPATNPIILDSRGTACIYAQGMYKFVITDSNDVAVATYDNLDYGVSPLLNANNTWTGTNTFQQEVTGVNAVDNNGFVTLAQMNSAVGTSSLPVGVVMMYGGSVAPNSSWLLCNGAAISRTTYATLFSIIGTSFGSGDGSTTFNIPDMRSRSVVGVGQGSGLSNRAMAATGGEETHTLTQSELPNFNITYTVASTFFDSANPQNTPAGNATGRNDGTVTLNFPGGGSAHNTMHPFIALNYIIKVS